MRRLRITLLLIICVLLTVGIVWNHKMEYALEEGAFFSDETNGLGITIVETDSVVQDKKKLSAQENPGICFEGVLLPFDQNTNTLYLPQSPETDVWDGSVSVRQSEEVQSYKLYALQDNYWMDKKLAIRENHSFTLWLVSDEDYFQCHLVITGAPMVSMTTVRIEEQPEVDYEEDPDKKYYGSETLHYGTISVFDPGDSRTKYELWEMKVCYHKKGASTAHFEKAGYSLSLLDHKEENLDVPLLGMRSDNKWKLNALVTDISRVREKTASQIWECFDQANLMVNEAGPRMEYVELVLDGDYRGLYCLVEPVDEKKLELDGNDILYKVIDWTIPTDADIQISVDKGWKIQYPVRIRFPKTIVDYQAVWNPMRDYLKLFYSSEEADYEEMISKVNFSNLFDMAMFTMVTSASDNCYKNTYYAAQVSGTGSYCMLQAPWDLDYTFGNEYAYGAVNNVRFQPDYEQVFIENALLKIKEEAPEEIGNAFWERWQEYRGTFLSEESITAMFRDNSDYIVKTGAVTREQERWTESGADNDLSQILEYLHNRLTWLDEYFSGWTVP